MATSGFGPYHGLWLDDTPTKCMDVMLTQWTMMDALGLVEILQAHKELVLSWTAIYCDFLECPRFRCVGWILMMKGGVRVGMKRQK